MGDSQKRNQLYMVVDAVGWPLGQSFLAPQTILAAFVAQLAGSNLSVGLVGSVQSLCQLVPQFLASGWIEQLKRTRIYVVTVGILVERVPLLVLALAVLLRIPDTLLLPVFFLCWGIANLGGGINMPAFMALFSRAIQTQRRGRVVGLGTSIGTLLAAGGAVLARHLLARSEGLTGYGWCFLVGFFVLLLTVVPLGFVKEGQVRQPPKRGLAGRIREVPRLLSGAGGFGRYILLQVALQFTLSGIVFVTSHAVLNLGLDETVVALGSAVMMGSNAVASLLFGVLGDRRGYRPVFRVAAIAAAGLFLLMVVHPVQLTVFGAYLLAGVVLGGVVVGSNMTLEFAGPRRTATFTAIVFTAVAPARIGAPLLCGWLADRVGLPAVFGINAAVAALAVYLAFFGVRGLRGTETHRNV